MGRKVEVTSLGRSSEGEQSLDKKSYRVQISEDNKKVVVEVRIPLGVLEALAKPEEWISQHFKTRPLPKDKEVIDIQSA